MVLCIHQSSMEQHDTLTNKIDEFRYSIDNAPYKFELTTLHCHDLTLLLKWQRRSYKHHFVIHQFSTFKWFVTTNGLNTSVTFWGSSCSARVHIHTSFIYRCILLSNVQVMIRFVIAQFKYLVPTNYTPKSLSLNV